MVFRGSIARRLIWLSTLRRSGHPPTTQDSLPAAGPALPDGIGYPQGSLRKVSSLWLSSFPELPCARSVRVFELAESGMGDSGPGRSGGCPPELPQIRACRSTPHPARHPMSSRPVRSVVVAWTRLRSRCTWRVSLRRVMRRHPLPSAGSLGLVPPLQRYYGVLRLPAVLLAALRFLRLAIPSVRPLFVPPGPGRGAVDQSGVGGRYLRPPCSMETAGSPKFPGDPL